MARMARIVVPGIPHHVTQRGNRRQQTFFRDADYREYLRLLRRFCREASACVWAYCLMPNHVHLVIVPSTERSLRRALGETHKRYSWHVNRREDWRGYLWQGRFSSYPMDEFHLLAAVRYVELNPVRAGLVAEAADWRWSSARSHLGVRHDDLIARNAMRAWVSDWPAYLAERQDEVIRDTLRRHQRSGRPLGSTQFVDDLERLTGRTLRPAKRGRKRKPRD